MVLGAGVRCPRGCGLVPCGARLPATAGCPPRPGNARGCWDDRMVIVHTSTGRCFVGRSGFRGMSPDFGRTWYTRIRTAGVASPPRGGRSSGASLSWSTGRACIRTTNLTRCACFPGGPTIRLTCRAGSLC